MSGKRKRPPTLEDLLARPACYYCDRDFDDTKILHDHQKAKHFHCQNGSCNRKLNTIGGLKIHMQQVHKEEIHEVPNALDDRKDISLEIFGDVGVPVAWQEARTAAVTQEYQRMQREHRQATGNPLPGEVPPEEASKPKRPRIEDTIHDAKARARALAAEKKAARAAAAAGLPPPGTAPAPTASPAPAPAALTGESAPFHSISNDVPHAAFSVASPPPAGFLTSQYAQATGPAPLQQQYPTQLPSRPPPLLHMGGTPPNLPPKVSGFNNGFALPPYHGTPPALQQPAMSPPAFNPAALSAAEEEAFKINADRKAEDFLAQLAAGQFQNGIAQAESTASHAAAGTPQDAPSTPQPPSSSKQKSTAKGSDLHRLNTDYEEVRSQAARYQHGSQSQATVGAPTDNTPGNIDLLLH